MTVAGALLAIPGVRAVPSTLNFDDLRPILNNFDNIPASYGDNLPNTPNVTVEYRTVSNTADPHAGVLLASNLEFWEDGYSDLANIAFAVQSGNLSEISLVAAPGYNVTLESFDLGGYLRSDKLDQRVRILDANYNVVLDYTPYDVEGDSGHSSLAPNVTRTVLRIQYGPDWNTGIDNIVFSQSPITSRVPDAGSSLVLLGSVATLLAGARICRRS
jgi:hypothetical protein